MGTRFLLTKESTVPDDIKRIYLDTATNGTVVTRAIDGYPQRVIRTKLIDALDKAGAVTRFPKAAMNALALMKQTKTSLLGLLREGWAMKKGQQLTWSQLAMAANAPMLTKASLVDGRPGVGVLPTGQVVGTIEELPTVAELIERIVTEAHDTLAHLNGAAPSADAAPHAQPARSLT